MRSAGAAPRRISALLCWCGLLTALSTDRVSVNVYIESGCPFSRNLVLGQISKLAEDARMKEIVSLTLFPLGNGYFETDECSLGGQARLAYDARQGGGSGSGAGATAAAAAVERGAYDVDQRKCFYERCGADQGDARPGWCFGSKRLVCQHGELECTMNEYMSCGKDATSDQWAYLKYASCIFSGYGTAKEAKEAKAAAAKRSFLSRLCPDEGKLARRCAGEAGVNFLPILACKLRGTTDWAEREAKGTPPHAGVPHVRLNGRDLDSDKVEHDATYIAQEICRAYTGGDKPAACAASATLMSAVDTSLNASREGHHYC